MRRSIWGIILFLALGGSVSCSYRYPIYTQEPGNNRTYTVDYLFEHDGCKVYRFHDMGHWVYFTNCQGEVIAIRNDSIRHRVRNSVRITYEDFPAD